MMLPWRLVPETPIGMMGVSRRILLGNVRQEGLSEPKPKESEKYAKQLNEFASLGEKENCSAG